MSRGYPDFFGQSIWPKYGTPLPKFIADNLNEGDDHKVMSITSQGVLFSLSFKLTLSQLVHTPTIALLIDNAQLFLVDAGNYIDMAPFPSDSKLLQLRYFSIDDMIMFFDLQKEIPFRSTAELEIVNTAHAGEGAISCAGRAAYYVVT
jgi:hypothetical protein